MPGDSFDNVSRQDIDAFLAAGVKDFYLWVGRDENVREFYTTPFWPGVGRLDEPRFVSADRCFSLPERVAYILERCPEARFMLRYFAAAPKEWREKYPEELALSEEGKTTSDTSLASKRYEEDHRVALHHMIRWVEAQPWRDRVMGYLTLHESEGTSKIGADGFLFDHSEPMRKAFREFKPEYTDFPSQKRFEEGRLSGRGMTWLNPEDSQMERDYFELMRQLFLRRCQVFMETAQDALQGRQVLLGMDALKQGMAGWQINPFFAGRAPRSHHAEPLVAAGSIGVDETLQIPGFNILNTPYDYTFRHMGGQPEPEGAVDSAVLRGKLFLVEDDCRSFTASEGESYGFYRNAAEVRAGYWRNAAAAIARGYQFYWMDVTGRRNPKGGYFRDPCIMETVASILPVVEKSRDWEHEDVSAIAVILDDRAALHEDFSSNFQNLASFWQRLTGLSQAGLPYRVYLWEDLLNDRLPDHRLFIFPNLFFVDDERMAVLRERVLGRGRVVLWGPGTGITDGKKLGADRASEVTGIPMSFTKERGARRVVLSAFDHAITENLPAPMAYGDSFAYGPLLWPEWDESASTQGIVLGTRGVNRPGLVIKEMGEGGNRWTSVYTAAVPVPGALIREFARHGGAHIYSEENDVILASKHFLGVHATRAGTRVIRLPERCDVHDVVKNEEIAVDADHLTLTITPPETRVFRLIVK
ncbi:hypothetical protein [Puniceicoccus vermicola]|nr:hypothetical protein [Puniceicoccus vermicola]